MVSSTTSTKDSGLFGHILPLFKKKTGIDVKVVSQGTGQALDTGRRGDADVVFVHARAQEEKFVADGFGVKRFPVMYNDFVLVGPKSDPAGVKGGKDIVAALKAIKGQERALHLARRQIRHAFGRAQSLESGRHRRRRRRQGPLVQGDRAGHGRGAQHRLGVQCLCADRSRHLAVVQEPRRSRHRGRRRQQAVQPVRRDPGEPGEASEREEGIGQAFIDWLVSPEGQKAIADYKINGKQLFFPNATRVGV